MSVAPPPKSSKAPSPLDQFMDSVDDELYKSYLKVTHMEVMDN